MNEDEKKKEEANAQASGSNTETPAVPPGVQARIDEMTAKLRETERQLAEQQVAWQQQEAEYQRLLTVQPQNQAPKPPATPEEALHRRLDQMQQYLREMATNIGYSQGRQALDFYGRVEQVPDEVQKVAQKLMADQYRQHGTVLDRDTAVTHAFGVVGRQDYQKKLAAQPPPNRDPNNFLLHSPGVAPALSSTYQSPFPNNFESWPTGAKAQWFKANGSKVRANISDAPIQRRSNT